MKTLSYAQLVESLKKPGATFACVESLTNARAKKINPFGEIFKKSRALVTIGASYQDSVNRQGEREGVAAEFVADSLPWGEWLVPNKVIAHKGELYLRCQTTVGQRRVRPAIVKYQTQAGERLNYDQVKSFLPEKKGSAKQKESGVTGEVQVRNIALKNILRLRLNGETVILKPDAPKQELKTATKKFVKILNKRHKDQVTIDYMDIADSDPREWDTHKGYY